MKLKIIKATIFDLEGKYIHLPKNEIIEEKEIENYRASIKKTPEDKVLLTFEEIG